MASTSRRGGPGQPHPAQRHLTSLQKVILQRLYNHGHRRREPETPGVPYTTLVDAVAADKTEVTSALRQLMRKGLVDLTLPRGGWTRCVELTEQGEAQAKTLQKSERGSQLRVYASVGGMPPASRHRTSAERRQRDRDGRHRRSERQARRRAKRGD